jgi:hypothetical protein
MTNSQTSVDLKIFDLNTFSYLEFVNIAEKAEKIGFEKGKRRVVQIEHRIGVKAPIFNLIFNLFFVYVP